jgi:2-polyprenyl-6-methoxyphenol hydroxylase-like FAD-dependent oxidoreductase
MQHDVDVLVVGAGPVGLFLACDLVRRGIAVRLVDRNGGPTDLSKALGVHARTMEAFQDMGIAETAQERGLPIPAAAFYSRRRLLGRVRFERLESPYPFLLDLEQGQTERLLMEHLAQLGARPERDCKLTGFTQDEEGVSASLEHGDGRRETCRARYLVGCDGAHSTVRHTLGLGFAGESLPSNMLLADVVLDWNIPYNEVVIAFASGSLLFVAPLASGRARVIGDLHEDVEHPDLATVQTLLDQRSPVAARASDPAWLTSFRISERQVERYRDGRVFLAGDAAHIHSPAGGQGMNTGIQDAYNLAWKLALAVRGVSARGLLDSYDAERRPVGAHVLAQTGRMLRTAQVANPLARFLRDSAISLLMQRGRVQRTVTGQLSQLAVEYTGSPIVMTSWHHAHQGLHAGERAPDGPVVDARDGSRTTLFEAMRGTGHVLLGFGAGEESGPLQQAVEAAAERHGKDVRTLLVMPGEGGPPAGFSHNDPGGRLHGRYGASAPSLYCIRPDGYIGLACRPPDIVAVGRYFARIFRSD